ncbi:phosphoribosylglycinamide formyltransferase [Calothrix sp. NIES-3974]|uniref:phosphoribosylglycinamide formyltransferase n=1 Tax=Calothrix sp. NIES-3974 TaxID=2005462 RepID=UPI000B5EDEDE|nr:phosphoribosylglycinamide formyltransferase [Calothrix sp. NIES-3974]BAZ03493.1 phosphoribosylglycinamide formyltransferase [Calothrix sp. NIES-3974]
MSSFPEITPSLVVPPIDASLINNWQNPQQQPAKLAIMASGNGSNFEAVAGAIASGILHAQIQVVIYNNPDAYVAQRAKSWGIPAILINHREFNSRQDFDRAIVKVLLDYQVEWVVMAGWMRLVTQVLIDAFPQRIINIHPSLLPSFKGVRAIEQALAAGVKITGCTVHLVCLEVDSGPILIQAAVPILPGDTPQTLHERVQIEEHRILPIGIALAIHKI